MNSQEYQPVVHRFAVATLLVSLLPIVIGALVTTKDAGMAFPDWPSSDGHNMFFYPWLQSMGDKFIEHGHRLAGALIGLTTIGLVLAIWLKEERGWMKGLSLVALLAVVFQGILGGQRVLLDARLLAMIHGGFAALVFALLSVITLCTSRYWFSLEAVSPSATRGSVDNRKNDDLALLKPLAAITPLVIAIQYTLGGMIRHFGTALHEHLALAFVVLAFVVLTATATICSSARRLRRPGFWMLAAVFLQLMLGAGAWVTKFGFASIGYVAVQHSTMQIALRTGHTVVGMVLFAASVVHAVCVFRMSRLRTGISRLAPVPASLSKTFAVKGGAR